MKKLTYLFTALLFAGATFLTSCSKSSDTTTSPSLPAIHFIAGAGYISVDQSVEVNTAIKFGISATANSGSLKRFYVHRTISGKPAVTVLDSTFTSSITVYTKDISSTAQGAAGSELWEFTITDSNGGSSMVSLTITTTVPTTYGPVTGYSNTILGSWNNSSIGSSFASSNGNVYKLAEAKANYTLIDWLYYYGVTNLATIAAPDDPDAISVFSGTNGLSTWNHRNATKFKKVTTSFDWNIVQNDSLILLETQSGVTLTGVTNLAVNDVLSFITEPGKKGLLKVTAITTGDAGSITYDVKVQQ
ncbi:MAG: hypothetical protein NTU98_05200 [Bacteroidetes bacterium]|nr:hypothetical protein [Bacteroidota bacterium]